MPHDLVIRGGLVVDGTGGPPLEADVAVDGGLIAAIGQVADRGREEIAARGRIVTPGFVDIHTHYDGQALWEDRLSPSSNHGVTTVIGGNCGIGFAPCRPDDRQTLIRFMEGVEDIPEAVMAEGLPWNWESFAEYLDALAVRKLDIDIGVQLPHSPLRVFAMGERGAAREPATDDDLALMRRLVAEAVRAGAIGVSTSRAHVHCARDGARAPSIESADAELLALAAGLADAGSGVFQLITEVTAPIKSEFAIMRAIAARSGRPLSFTLSQSSSDPERWRDSLARMAQAERDGLTIRGQFFPRPIGVMLGLDLSFTPFSRRPSYRAIADRPLADKVAILRDPGFRRRLLAEPDEPEKLPLMNMVLDRRAGFFPLGDPPDYMPGAERSAGACAAQRGVSVDELLYDLLLEEEGRAVLYLPLANFAGYSLSAVRSMMDDPRAILGLGDGGAHYGLICDASFPTTMLSHWVRDAQGPDRVPIEKAVRMLSSEPAGAVGLQDRGVIAPCRLADLNIIDIDRLRLEPPRVRFDLPGGGRRLTQRAQGYDVTVKSGLITYRNGAATGALPGRLVRNPGAAGTG